MHSNKIKKICVILGWTTTALIAVVGVLLILSCLDIYCSGDRPFSRETVSAHFDQIAWAVYLCIAAVFAGILAHFAYPADKQRPKALRDESETLRRLRSKMQTTKESCKEANRRRIYYAATALIVCGLAVYPVIYFLNTANFTISNLNSDVIQAVIIVLAAAIPSLGAVYICGILASKSIRREIEILKKSTLQDTENRKSKNNKILFVRIAVLAVAVCFIILGVWNEGIADVLGKAIRICTECIGLG